MTGTFTLRGTISIPIRSLAIIISKPFIINLLSLYLYYIIILLYYIIIILYYYIIILL